MGIVYEAEDLRLGRRVAIKILPDAAAGDRLRLERFHREARAASALNHPNICTVFDVGTHRGRPFMVMEFVDGETFKKLAERPVAIETLAQLGGQVAGALGAAHAAGVVHRDIKPLNLMVRSDGLVKVLDFGLARLVSTSAMPAQSEDGISWTGMVMGTVAYMSPEQARGETVNAASDIFSLGVTLYEVITGKHPFAAESPVGIMHAILKDSPLPPSRLNPEMSAGFDTLLIRMMEKQADRRPSAGEAQSALLAVAADSGALSAPRARMRAKRHTVGREKERAELQSAFESAIAGQGLIVSLAGEPGIGKTTLVEDFISDLTDSGQPFTVARGRCSERLAGTEAYMPILEALDSLLHGEGSDSATRALKLLAPTWYIQVAPSTEGASSPMLNPRAGGSQERLKRELGTFLQGISRSKPLILFFDDLQWADASTVDLLAYLATKFDALRLLVVIAYRPSDLLLAKHPFLSLKSDLIGRGLCREISLEFLNRQDVEEYLTLAFPEHRLPAELPKLVHVKTEGNALFMVDLVRCLRDQGVLAEQGGHWILARPFPEIERELPASVRGMIERKIGQLSEENRQLLAAASVQGYEFDSAVVAQALRADPAEVEERLEDLDRVLSFVRLVGESKFPDRTPTVRYRFVHVLYQISLYGLLRPTRLAAMSGAVAKALLGHYGGQSSQVASELAYLYETAREPALAAKFYLQAAQNAAQLFGYQEAVLLARRGLKLVQGLSESQERDRIEMMLELALGFSLTHSRGYSASETGASMAKARALGEKLGEARLLFRAIFGMLLYAVNGGRCDLAQQLGEELLLQAQAIQDPFLLLGAHGALGHTLGIMGQPVAAWEHMKRAISHYDKQQMGLYKEFYGIETGVYLRGLTPRLLWRLGYPGQARCHLEEAVILANADGDPQSQALALWCSAHLYVDLEEIAKLKEKAEQGIEHCKKWNLVNEPPWWLNIVRGWAEAEEGKREEGIALMSEGLENLRGMNSEAQFPHFLALFADQLAKGDKPREALAVMDDALELTQKNGEHYWDAELYRLRGEILEQVNQKMGQQNGEDTPAGTGRELPMPKNPESCFREALDIARRQSAKSLELRAAMSLARLLHKQGKRNEARSQLTDVYNWFTEGFDTNDLRKAKALINELA
jgi:adenylate cyclase